MLDSVKRSLDSLRQTEERSQFVAVFLAEIESAEPDDFSLKGKGGASISMGCITFTAVHGKPIHEQLSKEADSLMARMERGLSRARGGFWSEIDSASLIWANKKLEEFISSDSSNLTGGVSLGKIRQYFFCDLGKGDFSIRTLEFDETNYAEPRKNNPASTNNMVRKKSFETNSIVSYLGSLSEEILKQTEGLQSGILKLLKEKPVFGLGMEKWFASLTDRGSKGGILVNTCEFTDYRPLYCPKCVEGLVDMMREGGVRTCTLPPIPFTILDLSIWCTENTHRDHFLEDCLSVSDVEKIVNDLRLERGLDPHITTICEAQDSILEKKFGKWIWIDLE